MEHGKPLLPGLPDDLSIQCLARIARSSIAIARAVCHGWRDFLDSDAFFDLRKDESLQESWLCLYLKEKDCISWYAVDPKSCRYHRLPPDRTRIRSPLYPGCANVGSVLVVIGGHWDLGPSSWSRTLTNEVSALDVRRNSWKVLPKALTPRRAFACCAIDGLVYVAGGYGREQSLRSAEVFDIVKRQWKKLPDLHKPRGSGSGVELAGKFLVVAGQDVHDSEADDSDASYQLEEEHASGEVYDPEQSKWIVHEDLWSGKDSTPGPLCWADGKLYTIDEDEYLHAYRPDERKWSPVEAVESEWLRDCPSRFLVELDGKLLAVGGRERTEFQPDMPGFVVLQSYNIKESLWEEERFLPGLEGTIMGCVVIKL